MGTFITVCLVVCLFWANFLISGHRHMIVAHVTIEFAAGVNLKTHYQTNCNECATAFTAGVNLKRHETLRGTVRPYDILAHSTQRYTGFEWPLELLSLSDNVSMSDCKSNNFMSYNLTSIHRSISCRALL